MCRKIQNIHIIIMSCMYGQKVMNGTVANALRVHFHCTCGSLRSLTPRDREGGVFPVSHPWSWRGRGLSCLSHPWSGGRFSQISDTWRWRMSCLSVLSHLEVVGKDLSGLLHLEVEGWVSEVSHTLEVEGGSHTCEGSLSLLSHLMGVGSLRP